MKFRKVCMIGSFAGILVVAGCGGRKADTALFEERFTVKEVDLRDIISQTGEVRPLVKVEIKSEASGRIKKLYVREGQSLLKGDTILVIDPDRLLTQKEKLQLSLKRTTIDRKIAERDYNNGLELAKTGSVSEKKLQDFSMARDLVALNYQQQLLELRDIDDQLGKTVIVAPMSGVLTNLPVEEGEIAVSATSGFQSGTAIGTIADISRLEVITSIGEVDYVHLKKGQNVIIRPEALQGTETRGTINFVSLSAKKRNSEELASFEVRVSIDSIIPGIAPGINVNVEFVILEKNKVAGVPYHFVKKRGDAFFVDVVKKSPDGEEKIAPKKIVTGATDYRHYEVVSGLKSGETVYYRQETPGSAREQTPARSANVRMPGGGGRRR